MNNRHDYNNKTNINIHIIIKKWPIDDNNNKIYGMA